MSIHPTAQSRAVRILDPVPHGGTGDGLPCIVERLAATLDSLQSQAARARNVREQIIGAVPQPIPDSPPGQPAREVPGNLMREMHMHLNDLADQMDKLAAELTYLEQVTAR